MSHTIIRAYDASADVDHADRTVVATINTDAVDRFKTVIVPEGGRFENYRKNPIVLFDHGKADGVPVIGKNVWIKPYKRKVVAKTKFLPEGKSELADKVFDLYEGGFLNSWSISFSPVEEGPPTTMEIRSRPELSEAKTVYRAWDLLEYSAVTIPGNPEATREAIRRGLALPGWETRGMGEGSGADGGYATDDDDDDDDEHDRYIKQVGSEWVVYSEDGKVLGKHPTKAEAVKQLQAVEAHKHAEAGRNLPPLIGRTPAELAAEFRRRLAIEATPRAARLPTIQASGKLPPLMGRTLAEVAAERLMAEMGTDLADLAMGKV